MFEELVRNKQQQILHVIEIRKFKDEEKKLRSREQQIKTALESSHLQASSLNLERIKLQKEISNLQTKVRTNTVHSSYLLNLQNIMTSNLELHTRILAMLDTFNHRIAFSMSKVKTAKILHAREVFGLRNKLNDEVNEQKRVKDECFRLKSTDTEKNLLMEKVSLLNAEINRLNFDFKLAEEQAKSILKEANEKYIRLIKELEDQVVEKSNGLNEASLSIESLSQKLEILKQNNENLSSEKEKLIAEKESLRTLVIETSEKNEILAKEIHEKGCEIEENKGLIEKLQENMEEIEQKYKNEVSILEHKVNTQEAEIEKRKLIINDISKQYSETIEDDKSEIEFLKNKIVKLEGQVKELRRERDILFENVKTTTIKNRENKEVQTETILKHTIFKKTLAPVPAKFEDSETEGKKFEDS